MTDDTKREDLNSAQAESKPATARQAAERLIRTRPDQFKEAPKTGEAVIIVGARKT